MSTAAVIATVPVGGPAPYEVLIGRGVLGELPALLAGATRAVVLHPGMLRAPAAVLRDDLRRAAVEAHAVEVPDGEDAKTLQVAERCWDALGGFNVTRTDALVGLGGGATTDLAGWVAAAWLRGIRVVHVPTTLAGMVDAAIGGKTGINTARGKNLVGAFYPPSAVLCDLDALRTLPSADYLGGLAEVVKYGFIADPVILDLLEAQPGSVVVAGHDREAELIERSVRVKADVVGRDLTEQGPREMLN